MLQVFVFLEQVEVTLVTNLALVLYERAGLTRSDNELLGPGDYALTKLMADVSHVLLDAA